MADDTEALQRRVKDLEAILRQNDKYVVVTFKLSPQLANILGLLMAQPLVTAQTIEDRLGARDAKVAIHRLRMKLEPHGIKITAGRHIGYWLEPEDKKKIDLLVTSRVSEDQARRDGATGMEAPATA